MPQYKLIYLDGMGLAEVTRLLFALGDVPYEDVRLTNEQWLEKKSSKIKFVLDYIPVCKFADALRNINSHMMGVHWYIRRLHGSFLIK